MQESCQISNQLPVAKLFVRMLTRQMSFQNVCIEGGMSGGISTGGSGNARTPPLKRLIVYAGIFLLDLNSDR